MMNNTLKNQYNFPPGTVVNGKWHHNRYTLVRELGAGANGIVYLAKGKNGYVALKMSDNTMSVTSEVNVLKAFAKVPGSTLGPSLLDIDDWEGNTKKIPFYIMEYIQGTDLLTFIQKKGHSWTGVLMIQLLNDLHRLHQEGWVFGDLKPENLIVTGPPTRIRCIDVGGTTLQGRAIKEFTEFFDRGYWGAGTRKAEPSYDLFSVAMVMINLFYPKRFTKQGDYYQQLKNMIQAKPELKKFEAVLLKAIMQKYNSALNMRSELLEVLSPDNGHTHNKVNLNSARNQTSKSNSKMNHHTSSKVRVKSRQAKLKQKKAAGFFETMFIIMVVSFLYLLYVYEQLL